ncbi:MAG: DUF4013 domain-containing protein [Candidatus Woesearchaeota archaeon]
MGNFIDAIKRPFTEVGKLAIGTLLLIIPFVNMVSGVFAYGYILRCARTKQGLPAWDNWEELFVDGVILPVIILIYAIPFVGVLLFTGFEALKSVLTGETAGLGKSLVILAGVALLTAYIIPSALLSYSKNRRYWESFGPRVFINAIRADYLKAWMAAALYASIAGIIASLAIFWSWSTFILPMFLGSFAAVAIGISAITMVSEGFQ